MSAFEKLKVADVMVRNVVAVKSGTSITELARILCQHSVSGAPVLDENGKIIGMVSESDIAAAINIENEFVESLEPELYDLLARSHIETERKYTSGKLTVVDEIMFRNVLTVSEETPLKEAARIMAENRIHRLPVIKDGCLVGMIAAHDIIKAVSEYC
ncbi:MAG: CBS domain-containing protein [Planctomycetota bacterium]|nr:CBS domain-containing protein [Planctomycetota bacterium]